MTDIKSVVPNTVYTVEGNLAGARASRLTKERDVQRAEYEALKNKIKQQNTVRLGSIDDKFETESNNIEKEFVEKTTGLVTAEELRKAKLEKLESSNAKLEKEKFEEEHKVELLEIKKKNREKKRKKMSETLSFGCDDDEEEEVVINKKNLKNPAVDTAFLPDRDRDLVILQQKESLKKEWLEEQERLKNEMLTVVYSYWDGSGHRKEINVKKGTTIGNFLELVKQQLSTEFYSLRSLSSDSLMYIKEDLIIPQNISFYDLIITKARGKSGPLFHFDVHDDIRIVNDVRVEKDESHPGKVVERRW
jgi:protein FAM50